MTLHELAAAAAETLGAPLPEVEALAVALADGAMLGDANLSAGQLATAASLTNILLAVLARCAPSEAAVTVARFRAATVDPQASAHGETPRPILDHPLFIQRHALGEALDTIFLSYAAQDEFADEGYGLPITNMSLTVNSPQTLNYSADLWLDNGSEDWTLRYHRNHPDFDDSPDAARTDIARRLMAGRGDMSLTASVSSTTFYDLAEALSRTAGETADAQLSAALQKKK